VSCVFNVLYVGKCEEKISIASSCRAWRTWRGVGQSSLGKEVHSKYCCAWEKEHREVCGKESSKEVIGNYVSLPVTESCYCYSCTETDLRWTCKRQFIQCLYFL